MKNRLHITRIAALFIITLVLSSCATTYFKNGKESYNNLQYQDAIYFFEKGLKKKDDAEARRKLGESYLLTNDYRNAVTAYEGAVTYTDNTDKDRINYAKALMGIEHYADAKTILEGVISRDANNQIAADLLSSCKKVEELKKDSLQYIIEPVHIPQLPSLFSATQYNGGLIVSSPSGKGEKDPYTGGTYNNLFFTKQSGATWSNPVEIENVNGKYHDAAAAVSPNGQTMVFTRSFQLNSGKMAGNDQKVSNTQLYMSKKGGDGKWEKPFLLPFSDSKYMFAHPAFTLDGTKMYFASDMPGGQGAMDIWEVAVSEGSWGKPTNLGTNINTKGNEVFPTVRGETGLYFSSDAHQSLGGLDILFSSNRTGMWSIPKHVSYPVNTSTDDFGMIWNDDNQTGYFTSDRSGSDKLYSFTEEETNVKMEGLITDKNTSLPVKGAKIIIKNLTDGTETILLTDEDGKFTANLDRSKDYQILTEADGYFKQTDTFSTAGITEPITKVFEMENIIMKDPTDDGSVVMLNGVAINKNTGKPVPNAKVIIRNLTDGTMQTVIADAKGKFDAELLRGKDYRLEFDSKDLEATHTLTTKGADPNTPIAQPFDMWQKGKTDDGSVVMLNGVAVNKDTGKPVPNATVIIKNLTDGTIQAVTADANGKFSAELLKGKDYHLEFDSKNLEATHTLTTKGAAANTPIAQPFDMWQKETQPADSTDDGSVIILNGVAINKNTGKPVPNAKVIIRNLTDGTMQTITADANGKFNTELPRGKDYRLEFDSKDLEATHTLTTKGADPNTPIVQPFDMWQKGKQSQPPLEGGGTPTAVITIPNIFWDYNKANVRPDAEPFLDQVVKMFKDNSDLKFELRSHTDCRGGDAFNIALSERRAKAAADYLIRKGVPRSSIISRGMGEKYLINHCSDGVECTESEHQENRRTEFMVIGKK